MPGLFFGTLIESATGTSYVGSSVGPDQQGGPKSFQALHSAAASLSSTIKIEVANTPALPTVAGDWVTLGTISLVGSSKVTDGFVSLAPWKWYRGNITAASGTSTAISIYVGQTPR